jgi:hypothetical protein
MERSLIERVQGKLQRTAQRWMGLEDDKSDTGVHSCLRNAAAFAAWNDIEGDYLEFGVYRGDSFAVAYRAFQRERARRAAFFEESLEHHPAVQTRPRFFAFDSFAGLPEGPAARQRDYAVGAYACPQDKFSQNIARMGVNLKDVVLVPGFYDRSLTHEMQEQHELRRAAVVMIDCDLYESTVPVLNFLTNILNQGTILIFHDWFRFRGSPKCGEQRACGEWLARNPQLDLVEFWREGPQTVSFLVNLK